MSQAQTSTSFRMTPDEQATYDDKGFIIRNALFSADEVGAITDACEQLVADLVQDRQEGRRYKVGSYVFEPEAKEGVTIKWEGDTDIVHGLEPFAHMNKALNDWGHDPRFIDPMKDICAADEVMLFTEKLNLKRPFHGGVNPLHQDYPYWRDVSQDAYRAATAMLFLDDASLENGTLQVLPGSHKLGPQAGRTDSDAFGNLEMDQKPFEEADLVPVEVPAGSVVYFGSLLVHKSEPNRSAKERRTLLYSYQPAGWPTLRDFLRRNRTGG